MTAKVAYLSQAWLDLQQAAGGALPEQPGATARVQHVVSGGPEGEARYCLTITDGRLAAAVVGDDPDADVVLTHTYADATQIAQGALDANVAFMQGRVKVVGSMGHVMALMPLTQSEAYRAALAEVSSQTQY
ncbi:MAG: SCP2 sterol-binding domain-containing protein [Acidimicrobiales bacterium]